MGLLTKITGAKAGEGRALFWAAATFFFVLAAYYILRPVRDEFATHTGVRSVPQLYLWTFLVNLVVAPIFAMLIARLRRSVFILFFYGFLLTNALAFWVLLSLEIALTATQWTFFVWQTAVSVLSVSTFWSLTADVFDGEQARRMFPAITIGGSFGGALGSSIVSFGTEAIGRANLLLVSALLVTCAIFCAWRLGKSATPVTKGLEEEKVGGGLLAGFIALFKSPYLLGIGVWVMMLSLGNTFFYSIQTDLLDKADMGREATTAFFGRIDLTMHIINPILQFTITRYLLARVGVGITLSLVALAYGLSYASIALWPVIPVLAVCMLAMRASQYGLSNPARESLWPVVSREEKYKAKNVIDNAVFRGSDVWTSQAYRGLNAGLGLSTTVIAWIAAPLMAGWFVLSLILGRTAQTRAAAQQGAS